MKMLIEEIRHYGEELIKISEILAKVQQESSVEDIFRSTGDKVTHVAVYIGNGKMIGVQNEKHLVKNK